jgi:hypothetical protein
MSPKILSAVFGGAVIGLSSFGFAQETIPARVQIESYKHLNGKVPTYERNGEPKGEIAVQDLPTAAEAIDETGDKVLYRVETKSGPVWLGLPSLNLSDQAKASVGCDLIVKIAPPPAPPPKGPVGGTAGPRGFEKGCK